MTLYVSCAQNVRAIRSEVPGAQRAQAVTPSSTRATYTDSLYNIWHYMYILSTGHDIMLTIVRVLSLVSIGTKLLSIIKKNFRCSVTRARTLVSCRTLPSFMINRKCTLCGCTLENGRRRGSGSSWNRTHRGSDVCHWSVW